VPSTDPESLSDRILILLKERGSLKVTEIAEALHCERKLISQALFGSLAGRVAQDKFYRWTAVTGQGTEDNAAAGPLGRLCRYYLDCLGHDAGQGCGVPAASHDRKLDYGALKELPELRAGGTWPGALPESIQELVQRTRLDRTAVLYVGYPVLLRYQRSAKGQGYLVEPLLLYPLERDEDGVLQVAEDLPALNFRALRPLSDGGNVLNDVVALSDELGLMAQDEPPPLEDIALRLKEIRAEWPWIDEPVLGDRKVDPPLSSLNAAGIYNYAVVAIGEKPAYTIGLERELKDLAKVPDEVLQDTGLGGWLKGTVAAGPTDDGKPLLEVITLNTEQREAVRSAMTAPLTVITGPPGTGKSQVVTALLANCAWRGEKVLFASKNNKAVDVVEQRVNALTSRPTLIRLGSLKYEARLAEFLLGLLSASSTPEDQTEYERSREIQKRLDGERKELAAAEQRLIQARNEVDRLESRLEEWRGVFGESLGYLKALDVAALRAALAPLRRAIVRADRRRVGLIAKLFWFALRERRLQVLSAAGHEPGVLAAILKVGLQLPGGAVDEASVSAFSAVDGAVRERLSAIESIQQYLEALKGLESLPSLETLAERQRGLDERLSDNALRSWQAWARLQPARLSAQDRRAIGQYHAVLKVVLDCNQARTAIPMASWRQYRQLQAKVSHLIPCWAVTSLSVHGKVPFVPGFFDLLVIDEASQCDIASVLPLLYRAKRVVVIGDPKQLTHITRLSAREDAQLQAKHGIPAELVQWSYAVNSLFALASLESTQEGIVWLRDHHRSHADIIEFSNREFYEGRLRVATRYERLKMIEPGKPSIQWISVQGECRRPDGGSVVNELEARAVVELLKRLALKQNYQGSIGLVSPFRAQANRIRELVNADTPLSDKLERAEFLSETAHQFQGDERDVMIFSPVVSRGIGPGSLGFLRKNGNLFNVAITRARAALYVVGDRQAARESGVEYLAAFAQYVDEIQETERVREEIKQSLELGSEYPPVAKPELVSEWERVFYRALYAAGVRAIPQYAIDNYVLDFAVIEGERRLNIEVDGERYHSAWDGELMRRDRLRNQRMMELGWEVKRFWVYQIRDEMEWCVGEVKKWMGGEAKRTA
jgi:very-short-patch-repair endonuclease